MDATAARPKRKRSSAPRNDALVRVEAEIIEQAKLVVLLEGGTLAELISDLIRSPIERRYRASLARLNKTAPGA